MHGRKKFKSNYDHTIFLKDEQLTVIAGTKNRCVIYCQVSFSLK